MCCDAGGFWFDLMAYGLLITVWALSHVETIVASMSCPLTGQEIAVGVSQISY
jgi:hypothetical protein